MKCIIVFHLCRLSEWFTRDQLILLGFFSWYLRLLFALQKINTFQTVFIAKKMRCERTYLSQFFFA